MAETKEKAVIAQNSTEHCDSVRPSANGAWNRALAVSSGDVAECAPSPFEGRVTVASQAKPRAVSEARLQANRANANKSTGPRTARGKAWSRRNALQHGLTSRIVLFDPQGAPVDPNLQDLLQDLKQKVATGHDPSDPILQSAVREYAHQYLAIQIEARLVQNGFDDSKAPVSLRNLNRYRTTSERALLKSLAKRSVTK
jgi:hypothetical protein